ncbi:hypothetical protein GCM10027093_10720 [Paraburkholderia jirisanensis]
MPACVTGGEQQPVDEFRVAEVRLDMGDSHEDGSQDCAIGSGGRRHCGLPNLIPAPKLNRYSSPRNCATNR